MYGNEEESTITGRTYWVGVDKRRGMDERETKYEVLVYILQ